ncbi:MAG: hypothetical protein CMB80_33895 [Flammeovirgaceae bacterium]|nr:hypothetical protein [Flammeovirgaceae bacterium]MBE62076.1 hypothetical protein [Flammeovirgaceae bacterium]MBR08904.1 hypothetical protein [Rickettsiales bacterium]
MKSISIKLVILALLFTWFMTSCSENGEEESQYGTLSLRLTDAPFPTDEVLEANVTISKIEIRGKGEETKGSPFTTLSDEVSSYNLLDLTNGVTASLLSLEIPVGSYDLIRVYVSEASVVLNDGTTYDLFVPSGSSSGIKVFVSPSIDVAGGLTTDLLLDFDVAQSFVPQGNSTDGYNGFIFKPVIKGTNISTTGRLVGTVLDSLESPAIGAQITVYAGDTINTNSFTDDNGAYEVLGLEAGSYDVVYEYQEYDSLVSEDIIIVAANATTNDAAFPSKD